MNSVTETLNIIHSQLCDDASPTAIEKASHVIWSFYSANLITESEKKYRTLALSSCPGHSGRSWCAYCGNLVVEEELYNV